MAKIDLGQISGVGRLLFVICLLTGVVITAATKNPAGIIAGAVVGVYLLFAIKVVRQWEKAAVLRLGKYVGLRGPGIFHIVPIVETRTPPEAVLHNSSIGLTSDIRALRQRRQTHDRQLQDIFRTQTAGVVRVYWDSTQNRITSQERD